ncbi:MAG: NADH:ubiquinone oxidoreductase subunit NDUFA12 [Pseudomonadota bacterium]
MAQSVLRRFGQIFAWWDGTTWGTSFTTWRTGEAVGEDQFGNRYFRTKGGKIHPTLGMERRWVIYKELADPTLIPPGWYRWMHHMSDEVPDGRYKPKAWQKPHEPNKTGTSDAYRPDGSILRPDPEKGILKGYDAWTPS